MGNQLAERHCDIPNCYACERLARLQAEYQRDCAVQEAASIQADIERLAGIVNDRVEELRAVTKERDRLRKALNDAGDEFKLSDCEHTSRAHRIIERALLRPRIPVPDETLDRRKPVINDVIALIRKAQRADHLDECNALGAGIAEIERLTACLAIANANHEKFEREWYLRGDEIERLQRLNDGLNARCDELLQREGARFVARATADVEASLKIGDPCPSCKALFIGKSQNSLRCNNCGWTGPYTPKGG
jgi:hypothetical protein